jgi:hypothetical protein
LGNPDTGLIISILIVVVVAAAFVGLSVLVDKQLSQFDDDDEN